MLPCLNWERNGDKTLKAELDPARPRARSLFMCEKATPSQIYLWLIISSPHIRIMLLRQSKKWSKQLQETAFQTIISIQTSKPVCYHIDIFCIALLYGLSTKVKPLIIELTNNATPSRVGLRKCLWKKQTISNFIVKTLFTSFALTLALFSVAKYGTDPFYLAVELRSASRFETIFMFPEPIIEFELLKVNNVVYFVVFDLSHCNWQLQLHSLLQACQSFLTLNGVYAPTSFAHGTKNAVLYFLGTMKSKKSFKLFDAYFH